MAAANSGPGPPSGGIIEKSVAMLIPARLAQPLGGEVITVFYRRAESGRIYIPSPEWYPEKVPTPP